MSLASRWPSSIIYLCLLGQGAYDLQTFPILQRFSFKFYESISLSVQTFKAGFQLVPAFYALLATQNLGSSSKGPSHPRAVVQAYHSCGVVRQNIGLRTDDQGSTVFYPLFTSARNLQGLTSVVQEHQRE